MCAIATDSWSPGACVGDLLTTAGGCVIRRVTQSGDAAEPLGPGPFGRFVLASHLYLTTCVRQILFNSHAMPHKGREWTPDTNDFPIF